jgi:type VI secretion system secreted protein Hcp
MAVDIFLSIPKVGGESTDAKFAGQIDVISWNWGMAQAGSAGTGTGSGTGKVNVGDLSLTKYLDKSSPVLMAACCGGTAYSPVVLTMRKAGNNPLVYLVITLGNVTISGVNPSTSIADDRQTETVSLHFGTFQVQYTPQNSDGSGGAAVTMTWNIPGNSSSI